MRFAGLLAVVLVLDHQAVPRVAGDQAAVAWRDPSPHRVQFVTVDDDVHLEVLDWGGTGRPLVLLAGYLTAHAYDDLAPTLTGLFHVYGITRRGLGASSSPASGYTAQRSADDVLQVLDALKLQKPVLAGHSFGGYDVTNLAARHPDRLSGLVYLNSAEDPTLTLADYEVQLPAAERLPASTRDAPPPDLRSPGAYRDWQRQTMGGAFPEAEIRQLFAIGPDGTLGRYLPPQHVRDALFEGRTKPDYQRITVPVLAFVATSSLEDQLQRYKPETADQRAALEQQVAWGRAYQDRHLRDLRKGVPSVRVVQLPGANFYIFLSNGTDIVREMRSFAASLK